MTSLPDDTDDPSFENLIRYIQDSRGFDFRGYKRSSLRRRIALRMEHVNANSFAAYNAMLEADPHEFNGLLNTILIKVTSFFRDPDAWEALRQEVLPKLLAPRRRDAIRIWSVGCASGEEAYSLAMVFAEALGAAEFARRVKIYATDLDEAALHTARHAAYLPRDLENVPQDLRQKYFDHIDQHHVVSRELRKCVIFGRHNIVNDAPISRIDLLACRNLLIYLSTETQNLVLPRLHYALVADGILFLGKAETQLARSKLFQPLDIKHRLFQKVPRDRLNVPGDGIMPRSERRDVALPQQTALLDAIVENSGSAHIALDADGIVVFLNAQATRMLEVGEADVGRPFHELSLSYRPVDLRSRIDEAYREGRPVHLESQAYHRPPADPIRVSINVTPLASLGGQGFTTLLTFTDTTRTYQLQQALEAAQESLETTVEELQSANEELETTNEELQSTNEELETTNEELQSTNEELETTNEELRSTNEQLETTNEELRRQSGLAHSYRQYAEAILRSTNSGIIVLDGDQRVRSWNRWSENAWGLREEETVGRKFIELDIGLPAHELEPAVQSVIAGGEAVDHQVNAVERRGRSIRCRVRVSPLLYEDRTSHGAVLFIEEAAGAEYSVPGPT
jgi:two-component system, chemotaxis family, CheB/CheR fusion protein